MSNPLNYISLARKAGLVETGEESSGVVIRSGKAKLLVIAADASDNAVRRAEGYIQGRNVLLLKAPYTKLELASAAGKSGCSMLVFTDLALACSFVSVTADEHPGEYDALRDEICAKNDRAKQRRKKAHGNDMNKKTGKRRTIE